MNIEIRKKPLVLGPRLAGTAMTPEEFDAVTRYNEKYGYELINGVLIVNPIPLPEESDPNGELEFLLRLYRQQNAQGSALDATMAQQHVQTRANRRLADRVIWAGLGRLPILGQDLPTIVVEFVSRARRDRQRDYEDKRREYMDAGIAEYWIIDRFRRTLTVVKKVPGSVQEKVVQETETYESPLLPGFTLPLAHLLAVADRWAQARRRRR
jgi:Uma2 family endonuclease